jgi:hypothetical protein
MECVGKQISPSTSRCKVCVVWEAVPRCEKQSFSANTIGKLLLQLFGRDILLADNA